MCRVWCFSLKNAPFLSLVPLFSLELIVWQIHHSFVLWVVLSFHSLESLCFVWSGNKLFSLLKLQTTFLFEFCTTTQNSLACAQHNNTTVRFSDSREKNRQKNMTGPVPSQFEAGNTNSIVNDPQLSLLLSSMAIDPKKLELLEQRLTGPPSQNLSNIPPNHNSPTIIPTPFPTLTSVPPKSDVETEQLLNASDDEVVFNCFKWPKILYNFSRILYYCFSSLHLGLFLNKSFTILSLISLLFFKSSSKDTQQGNKEQPKKKRKLFTKEEDAKILEVCKRCDNPFHSFFQKTCFEHVYRFSGL